MQVYAYSVCFYYCMCVLIQSSFLFVFHQNKGKYLEPSGKCLPTSQTIQANCTTTCQWKVGISPVDFNIDADDFCDDTIHWTDVMTFTTAALGECGDGLAKAGPGLRTSLFHVILFGRGGCCYFWPKLLCFSCS